MHSQMSFSRNRFARLLLSAGVLFSFWHAQAQPTILSVVPANGATGISTSTTVVFTFTEAMNPDPNVTSAFFYYGLGNLVATTPSWSAGNTVLTCTPVSALPANTTIQWAVTGESAGGQPLGGIPVGSFTTGTGGGGGGGGGTGTNAITSFTLGILHNYDQTSASLPVLETNAPYAFTAYTALSSNRTANSVTVTLPTAVVSTLMQNPLHPEDFTFFDFDTNLSTFNDTYPSGDYQFEVMSAVSNQTVTVNFPSTLIQPGAPHLTNYMAAQAVNASQPFTLGWDAFTGGTAADAIFVQVGDVFSSPDIRTAGALSGTARSIVIPAGTLQPASSYDATVAFYRYVAMSNGTSYATTVYRATSTHFTLITTSGIVTGPLVLTNAVYAGGGFNFDVLCSPGQQVTVEYKTNLAAVTWQTLLTTNSPADRFRAVAPPAPGNPVRLFRARSGP